MIRVGGVDSTNDRPCGRQHAHDDTAAHETTIPICYVRHMVEHQRARDGFFSGTLIAFKQT
jgi:hypothetical protein